LEVFKLAQVVRKKKKGEEKVTSQNGCRIPGKGPSRKNRRMEIEDEPRRGGGGGGGKTLEERQKTGVNFNGSKKGNNRDKVP